MGRIRHIFLVASAVLTAAAIPSTFAAERGKDQAISVFAGVATDASFTDSMFFPWNNRFQDIGVIGVAYSKRLGELADLTDENSPLGENLSLEGEVGLSARFGHESLGEVWTGLYLRYDGFPWNDKVYTTIAVNTGLSLLTNQSAFERGRDENNKNAELLHYMGPEITFANPDNKDMELLVRFHHRSGVFGLFDGVISGSTFISTGVRMRF